MSALTSIAYCLSSSPCPPPLFLRIPLCRLLYVHQHLTLRQLSSSVFRGQWSFVSSSVYRSVLSALYHGNIPFHLPVCVGGNDLLYITVGGPACIAGRP